MGTSSINKHRIYLMVGILNIKYSDHLDSIDYDLIDSYNHDPIVLDAAILGFKATDNSGIKL